MIRRAQPKDIPQILELGAEFHAISQFPEIPYSPASTERSLEYLLEKQIVYVADKNGKVIGTAGGATAPVYFNNAYSTGQELFWYVQPEHRNGSAAARLLFALERAAKAAGATYWTMISLEAVEPEKVGKLYRKAGYKLTEHSHTKVL